MKMAMKNLTVFWGALLSFMVACSLNETASSVEGEACEDVQDDCATVESPDAKNPNAGNSNAEDPGSENPDAQNPPANEPERDSLQNEKLSVDSLAALIDTVIVRDTLVVYKDTVYDTTYSTDSYTSFVYRENRTGELDTVTRKSQFIDCEMKADSFSCQWVGKIVYKDFDLVPVNGLGLHSCGLVGSSVYYRCETDTLYHEAYHKIVSVPVADTSFINYGDTRKTDYIPPEYVYMQGEHPFDSTEIQAFFDTLDVSAPEMGGKQHIVLNSKLTFDGFPLTVLSVHSPGIVLVDPLPSRWPRIYYAATVEYNFSDVPPLQSDTTVTWTLGYTHYEKGIEETDSIQVTTFFKVE